MSIVVFRNAALLVPGEAELRPGHDVLVEGGRIREVSDRPIRSDAARTVDVAGRTLMPGLIDCHVHTVVTNQNFRANELTPNVFVTLRAVPMLEAILMRGFTTVRDAGGADWALAEATAQGLIRGPRIFPSGKALSQTGGHGDFRPRADQFTPCACAFHLGAIARVVDGVDAVRIAAREEIAKGATQIKVMASGGVVSPNDPVHFLGYSEAELRAIVEEAENASTYVMAHAFTPRAIRRAVDCGIRTIEHGNLVDAETARHVAAKGAYAVPTTIVFEALIRDGARYGLPPESVAKLADVGEAGLRALELWRAAGVKLGYGSDLQAETQLHQSGELRIRAEVMGAAAVIDSATRIGAEILNRTGELGVIAPGAIADLLVVDGDPLRDIGLLQDQGRRLRAIVKAGAFCKNEL